MAHPVAGATTDSSAEVAPDEPTVVPATLDDPALRAMSEVVGGPMGKHAIRHPWWSPVAVLMVLTAIGFGLGMLQKTPCWVTDWQNTDMRYSAMCYSDLPYLYDGRGLSEQHWPYTSDPEVRSRFQVMEYPVGISYWAWGTAVVTQWFAENNAEPIKEMKAYFTVNTFGFALLALLSTWLLAGVDRRRPWDAAGFALAPVLMLGATINWDMVAVVFVAGALWAWARGRPGLTGVMLGVGTAVKLYPAFLLGAILVICWRRRAWGSFASTTGAAVVAWVLANAPAVYTGLPEWKVFWSFNSERTADLGSIWLLLSQAYDKTFTAETINLWSELFFAAWCVGVLIVGLLAPKTPRFAQLGFLIIVGFLLINKVYSPQYMLWLLPLAVMARPRWRDLLIWQLGEVLYFAAVWWYLANKLLPGSGDDPTFYWLAILLRLACELYLVAVVVRDLFQPEHDPVDRDDPVDPVELAPTRRETARRT